MTPAQILQLAVAAAAAVPQILALFENATSGATVTEADIEAAMSAYNAARAAVAADLAEAASQAPSPAAGP